MCGLGLIVSQDNSAVSEEMVRCLNERIKHRGPNGEGYYFGKNFAFSHRRLSVIDLSHNADQPAEKDGDCIIFNGMIYNYLELKDELCSLGHTFKSKCDTEVILASYQQWGTKAFSRFNGMWAFIIYDADKNKLILCRDRFGIKPLYITTMGEYFMAASEIKQFIDFPQFQPVLNVRVANHFLKTGVANYSNETFFKGVFEVRPGHYIDYNLSTNKYIINQWYDLKKEIKPQNIPEKKAVEMVRDLLIDSLYLRCKADVKVGSCLSGGLDSSSMVALLHSQKIVGPEFKTITSCYTDKAYDEQEYSDVIINQTGFKSIKVFPELNNLFDKGDWDKMIYHFDQPFSSASHYSEFMVFKEAKKNNLTVMLDGQGADEFICGYLDYFYVHLRQLMRQGKFREVWKNLKAKSSHHSRSVFSEFIYFIRFYYYSPFIKRIKKIFGVAEHPWLLTDNKSAGEKKLYDDKMNNIVDMSLNQMLHSSIGYQLHSQDRNSMLFSIESRVPFLDHRLVENILGLPSKYKIQNGYSKYILIKAVSELPDMIKYRKTKMSFAAPDSVWMRENQVRIRKELEDAIAYTGMFSNSLLGMFDEFTKNKTFYDHNLFFRVISFYRFCRIFKMKFKSGTYAFAPYVYNFIDTAIQY